MTNQEINRVIAEFRGWVMYHPTSESISRGYPSYSYWTPPRDSKQFAENWGKLELDYPPDYCNDLNAMHEAEKMLTAEQARSYDKELQKIGFRNRLAGAFWLWHFSAAWKAEAFLKTIGKWD
jgi:hypothetical protein